MFHGRRHLLAVLQYADQSTHKSAISMHKEHEIEKYTIMAIIRQESESQKKDVGRR